MGEDAMRSCIWRYSAADAFGAFNVFAIHSPARRQKTAAKIAITAIMIAISLLILPCEGGKLGIDVVFETVGATEAELVDLEMLEELLAGAVETEPLGKLLAEWGAVETEAKVLQLGLLLFVQGKLLVGFGVVETEDDDVFVVEELKVTVLADVLVDFGR